MSSANYIGSSKTIVPQKDKKVNLKTVNKIPYDYSPKIRHLRHHCPSTKSTIKFNCI